MGGPVRPVESVKEVTAFLVLLSVKEAMMSRVKRQNMKIVRRPNGDVFVIQRPSVVAAKKREMAAQYTAQAKREARRPKSLRKAIAD